MDIQHVFNILEQEYISNSRHMQDFGVWNVAYQIVPCESNWAGSNNAAALGSVSYLGPESVCCPANPTVSANTLL